MNVFYILVANLMIIVSILAMIFFMCIFVLQANNTLERFTRVLGVTGGVLIFLGAKYMGVSIPELMFMALDPTGGSLAKFFIYILPAISGAAVTFLLFNSIENSFNDNKRINLLILMSTITIMVFTDIYIEGFSDKHKSNIMLNISFLAGVILTILFQIDMLKSIYSFVNRDKKTDKQNSVDSWKKKY